MVHDTAWCRNSFLKCLKNAFLLGEGFAGNHHPMIINFAFVALIASSTAADHSSAGLRTYAGVQIALPVPAGPAERDKSLLMRLRGYCSFSLAFSLEYIAPTTMVYMLNMGSMVLCGSVGVVMWVGVWVWVLVWCGEICCRGSWAGRRFRGTYGGTVCAYLCGEIDNMKVCMFSYMPMHT